MREQNWGEIRSIATLSMTHKMKLRSQCKISSQRGLKESKILWGKENQELLTMIWEFLLNQEKEQEISETNIAIPLLCRTTSKVLMTIIHLQTKKITSSDLQKRKEQKKASWRKWWQLLSWEPIFKTVIVDPTSKARRSHVSRITQKDTMFDRLKFNNFSMKKVLKACASGI